MADPTVPLVLSDLIKELRRRVANLENAQRLVASSLQGGLLRVLDSDGSKVVTIGRNPDDDDRVGVTFYDADGVLVARAGDISFGRGLEVGNEPDGTGSNSFLLVNTAGVVAPHIGHSWQREADAVTITSGSFTTAWSTEARVASYHTMTVAVTVIADSGTTGEFRLRNVTSGVTTDTVSVGSGEQKDQTFKWAASSHVQVGLGPYVFTIEARRVSGSGNVYVYAPRDLSFGGINGATTTGV